MTLRAQRRPGVLARYMQIISGDLIREAGGADHQHSPLFPAAFIGAGPYTEGKDSGVKLVGATAHYVTEDSMRGTIIEAGRGACQPRRHGAHLVLARCRSRGMVLARPRVALPGPVLRDGNRRIVSRRGPRAAQPRKRSPNMSHDILDGFSVEMTGQEWPFPRGRRAGGARRVPCSARGTA